jgi:hypothetical protein
MLTPIHLAGYWAVAFFSLAAALVLLNIYSGWIGNNLELGSAGKEAAIAGVASLVEAGSLWLILSFAPGALRAMIFAFVVVAVIYKAAHFEDWNKFDVFMLLAFQVALVFMGVSLVFGHFQMALALWVGFVFFLFVVAGVMRSLG